MYLNILLINLRLKMTAILGGGISGLSAAYYSIEHSKLGPIVLYEASDHLGGWIKSIKTPNGVIFEKGPRTIRPRGPAGENTLELIDELNLNNKIIPINTSHPAARNRLIYANNKLHILPNTLSSLFKINEPFNRPLVSIIWNDLKAGKIVKEDESMYNFVERRMGKDIADYLISPMLCGICAGNAKEISVNFLLKTIFELEQKHGSISKGLLIHQLKKFFKKQKEKGIKNENKASLVKQVKEENWSVWGLKGGLEQLPITLKNALNSNSQVTINMKTKCEQITFKNNQVELLVNGKIEQYHRIISTLSANCLAPLLQRQHPQLSRELGAIPSVNVVVINLHYSGKVLPMEAFGFLVPPHENLPILGVIFDSCVFKNNTSTVLTVMMGGAWFHKYFDDNITEDQFLSIAVDQMKNILKIKDDPVEYDIAVLKNCIPQYVVGHAQRVQRIKNYISSHKIPLALCGSSYFGVGLNDVILSAKQAVLQIGSD